MGFFRTVPRESAKERADRQHNAYVAWSNGPESTRRNNVFDAEFDEWIERLRIAQERTETPHLTVETLELAGARPVVDSRGLSQYGVDIELQATAGAYTQVASELAGQVRQEGGPADFWEDVGRYISTNGFEVLYDYVE